MLQILLPLLGLILCSSLTHASSLLEQARALLEKGPETRKIYQGEPRKNLFALGEKFVDRAWHGYYSDERHAFQQSVVSSFLDARESVESPEIIFTAGAFGAGKTRILNELFDQGWLDRSRFLVVNMDEFRHRLPEYELLIALRKEQPEDFAKLQAEFSLKDAGSYVQIESGYLQEMLLWQALTKSVNIVVDGSLGNQEYFERLLKAIRKDFPQYESVGVIRADAGERALERALKRGAEKSRQINPDSVRRSMREAKESYEALRPHFDYFIEVDNSGESPVFEGVGSDPRGRVLRGLRIPITGSWHEWKAAGNDFDRALEGRLRKGLRFYDLVFDIDWTLFYALRTPSPGSLQFEGQHFLPYRGFARFFEVLFSLDPNLRMHFVSGAPEKRIRQFLDFFKIRETTSLLDVTYSITGAEGLPRRPGSEAAKKFMDIYAKSFELLTPQAEPSRSILLDDQPGFATSPLLAANSHGNFAYFASFAEAQASGDKHAPKSLEEWARDRDRLALIIAVIEEALKRDRAGLQSFADTMQEILGAKATGEEGAKSLMDPTLDPYFARGRALLGFEDECQEELLEKPAA
jgi:hypothetical protein